MNAVNLAVAALLALAPGSACTAAAPSPAATEPSPVDLLRAGFAAHPDDPLAAADLLARAADDTELECLRLEIWLESLEAAEADVERWRAFLAADPPSPLARRAEVGLARALLAAGARAAAWEAVSTALAADTTGAVAVALDAAPEEQRRALARRLAVSDPRALAGHTELEAAAVADLDVGERLERAVLLREQGRAAAAAAELVRLEPPPELAARRRLELGRAWVDVREPERALAAVPEPQTAAEWLVHARAHRRTAWNAWPGEEATPAFQRQLEAARAALAAPGASELRMDALEQLLEAGTQTGALDEAWDAWVELVLLGWHGERREWLGRRLGLALIRAGGPARERARVLARALPEHQRAFDYWLAATAVEPDRRRAGLETLAAAPVPDLYAQWARADLGRPVIEPAPEATWAPPLGAATPPPPVGLLLEWEEEELALREWRRRLGTSPPTPAEALAVARLERDAGEAWRAIRLLVGTFPELGGIELRAVPRDVAEAYLPLPWPELATRAAARNGLDPALLAGLVRQESIWDAGAVSAAGAVGVAQLMPATAARHARALGMRGAPDLTDPQVNLTLGARELAALIAEFGALEPALAGYNAGPNRPRRWLPLVDDARAFTEIIAIPETYTYVRRVPYLAAAYHALYGDALAAPEPAPDTARR